MSLFATEQVKAEQEVSRALGLASHATRSLHMAAAQTIAGMRYGYLTDGEIVTAVRALLAEAEPERAKTYRAVLATMTRTRISNEM
jgi:hypothetical protein